mgnify:CR=1 FL=1
MSSSSSTSSTSSTSSSIYFPDPQRSLRWKENRRPISGTTLAKFLGFCSFTRPSDAYTESITGTKRPIVDTRAIDHGNKYEKVSECVFLEWLKTNRPDYADQIYTEPGYDVPDYRTNRLFTEERDVLRFGVSLDVRGSIIDCEIKNPISLSSYQRYYEHIFSPSYFLQVQWAMAIRNRSCMYFIATAYEKDGKLLDHCIWMVEFAEDFFNLLILPAARRIADHLLNRNTDYRIENEESPWINEKGSYTQSTDYSSLFHRYCSRIL